MLDNDLQDLIIDHIYLYVDIYLDDLIDNLFHKLFLYVQDRINLFGDYEIYQKQVVLLKEIFYYPRRTLLESDQLEQNDLLILG